MPCKKYFKHGFKLTNPIEYGLKLDIPFDIIVKGTNISLSCNNNFIINKKIDLKIIKHVGFPLITFDFLIKKKIIINFSLLTNFNNNFIVKVFDAEKKLN